MYAYVTLLAPKQRLFLMLTIHQISDYLVPELQQATAVAV
jgi:hypothetical protein